MNDAVDIGSLGSPVDIGSLGAHALKKMIAAAGLEYYDCIEISELRARARQAIEPQGASEPAPGTIAQGGEHDAASKALMQAAQRSKVVRLPSFLTEDEIKQVHELAAESQESCRPRHQAARHRSGIWDTLYLSAGGTFRRALPKLYEKLIAAAVRVDAEHWGELRGAGGAVVPRVIEYHTVRTHGSLPWVHHCDEGVMHATPCSQPKLPD